MSARRVLILTHSGDHYTVDRVAESLERRGARPFRFDTDRFPRQARLSVRLGNEPGATSASAEVPGGGALDVGEVCAVWARRLWEPDLGEEIDQRLRDGCVRESAAALHGWLGLLAHARWVNDPAASSRAQDKLRQLRAAAELGLCVPRTLVTNDPERVRAFYDELGGRVVAKMLTPLSQSMAKAPLFVRTSAVAPADLEALDGLRYSPMVFQERIEKALELRVAVVGERLFAGAIDASASAHGQVDWRGASAAEVRWQSGAVEPDAAGRLTALTRALGLVYGAVDLIREPSGRLVFLEINPGGEWGMLERDLGLPIADALAEALLETAEIAR